MGMAAVITEYGPGMRGRRSYCNSFGRFAAFSGIIKKGSGGDSGFYVRAALRN